ncbi:protein BIIDXI-like [Phragmites australis]|uniref:protein BIIDXI-like n=1 Tax=Phragmites australis TaxID=29695 RepID=UPI002D789F17|nr:protein BIIDXI-like [Phragmites australis]
MRRVVLLLLVCAAARAAAAVTDGLLPNGNFEEGPPKSQLVNGTVVRGVNAIPRWQTSGFVEYIESGHKQGDMLLVVPQGAHAVRLGNEASIRQRLAVTRGSYYAITFSAARTCAQAERLNVSVSPEWGVLPMQTIYGSNGWDSYAWAFKAKLDVVTLVIHNPGVEEDPACGPLIDAIAIRALYPPKLVRGNMLKNGGFEEGPYFLPNASWGVLVPPNIEDDHSPLPAWMIVSSKAVKYVDSAHFAVPRGARAVELVGGSESALVQEVRTVPGWSYRLSFAVGDAADGCAGSMVAEAYAARATVRVPYESKGTGGYKRAVLDFMAIANRTRVVFQSTFYHMKADGTLCGPVVDDASLVGLRKKPAAGRRLL